MRISVAREIKESEYRVGLTPSGAAKLAKAGHEVFVETMAGAGSGFSDELYKQAGAVVLEDRKEIFGRAEMLIKVKEPQPDEIKLLRRGQIVFTYFHFAADKELTQGCLDAGIVAIAYETIRDRNGRLPCLTPMSEIAGKMSIQMGAKYLEKPQGGRGILLGGVPGVAPAKVLVLGAGVVGATAANVAAGMGADVVLMDISLDRLRYLADIMPANVNPIFADEYNKRDYLQQADMVIGAVLIPGGKAPKMITAADLKRMKPGSVIVDVAIDQGGCAETSRPTKHSDPTYLVDGIIHYCVANIPGAVPLTSTAALCNSTISYAMELANLGYEKAIAVDPGLATGLNMAGGEIRNAALAEAMRA